ncbi:MAG: tail fiber domain-containing protein [Bacteroidia bacterium]
MTSAATPQTNPGNGVLSVNAQGDVIYVPGSGFVNANNGLIVNATGAVQLGGSCGSLTEFVASALTNDRTIFMNNKNFWFADGHNSTSGLGVGGNPTGLAFCNVGNTFEISANNKNIKYGNTSASGLRFTKLPSSSPTVPNGTNGVNSAKVLTVDQDGDVVLTDASTGIGNICGAATQNPLLNNWEIPMNGFNYNFTNPVNSQSSIHIGNSTCSPTIGRLNVYNDNLQVGGVFSSNLNTATNSFGIYSTITNAGSGDAIGIHAVANTSGAGNIARGLRGEGIAANGLIAQGVKGTANTNNNCAQNIAVGGLSANGSVISISGDFDVEQSNSPTNQGVNVEVINGTNSSATNVGINVSANSIGSSNFGGIFVANGATNNYAVFAQAPITAVQTPGSTPSLNGNYAGYFNGDVVRTGTDNFTSDQMLKQNIDSISNAMTIINQLKPKSYDYKISSFPSMHLPSGKQYGLIAQDVQSVLPELVNNNTHPAELDSVGNIVTPSFNYLSLEYQQLIAIMLKGMQEQQQKIDSLTTKLNTKDSLQDARLSALEAAIASCCASARTSNNSTPTTNNSLDIELSDKDAIVLNQNVPNPFAEQTTITYNVPASVEKAQLIFFNSNGQVIQTVDIKTRGKGKVNVFAADLSSGLYHYSLVADGKVVDSKKMVRE